MEDRSSDPTPVAEPARKPGRVRQASFFRDLLLSLIIAAVVILFIYQPVEVEGYSMMPNLVDRERIFINKFTYRFGLEKIERGDLVVFYPPVDRGKSFIKRVIGLPGDDILIRNGTVYVNGKPLQEEYVPSAFRDDYSAPRTIRVPHDHYYVMGDHRKSSYDSRSMGVIRREDIYGKAVFVYWPLDKLGPVH
jgi:signal peptidase I